MSNRSNTNYSAPTDANRRAVIMGVSTVDGITPVPLEVNPSTGQLQTSGSGGGGGGTQYAKGASVTTPTGTVALGQNASNVLNPLTIDLYGNQTNATYDNAGNGIGSGLYNGQYYLNADISSAGTDGAVYNTTSFPQIDAVGGKGTDGNAHVLLTDPNGKLATTSLGVVDPNNSTTTTLSANATYTGTSTSVLPYSSISVILYSNVASATQGLAIEFSMDGTNWDDSSTFSFTPGTGVNQGQTFKSPARSQYYRIQYTNGATNQTTFRLQTVLKPNALIGDSVAIGSTITTNNHSLVTTSSIVGLSTAGGGNTYVPVKVTNTGQLSTTANISDSNGAAIAVGQTTKSASLPVTLASDQGSLSVSQATASSLNATVVPGTATNSAVPSVSYPVGFQARSTDITATTSTYNTIGITDLVGKQVVMPYAINQNFQNGTASATGTTSTSLISAVTSNSIYLTSVQIMNTGSTTTYIALQDGSGGTTKAVVQAPAGGGSNITFPVPIKNTSGNAWYFAAGSSSSTIYVSAQGYAGV